MFLGSSLLVGFFANPSKLDGSFAHDIVQAASRVNYMSNLDYIHGLGAMVRCLLSSCLLAPHD